MNDSSNRIDNNIRLNSWQGKQNVGDVAIFTAWEVQSNRKSKCRHQTSPIGKVLYLDVGARAMMSCDKNQSMNWVYLSPHYDDVVLSCGGLIWEQSQAGNTVSIWTICAGEPPTGGLSPFAESLHARWETSQTAVLRRREEDLVACELVGAGTKHLPIPDCIYRQSPISGAHLYTTEASLFDVVHPDEQGLIDELSIELKRTLPTEVELVCPYGIGGHVDHRLTRAAAERLRVPLWFYADYPYAEGNPKQPFDDGNDLGCERILFPVTQAGLDVWVQAVAAHASQISTFWSDLGSMQVAIYDYAQRAGGVQLLKCKQPK